MHKFSLRPGDTGSTSVQVANLSVKIDYLSDHVAKFKKDKAARRALDQLYNKRRSLMKYLRRKDFDSYVAVVKTLNLEGTFK